MKTETIVLPLGDLFVSEANVRKHGVSKDRLSETIAKEGFKDYPIHVYLDKKGEEGQGENKYGIMDGQHRYYGSLAAGIKELECILHLDIQSLEDAKQWCRREICYGEDILPIDKMKIAIDLARQYGSVRKGCEKEGLPYERLKHWYRLRKVNPTIPKMGHSAPSLRDLVRIAKYPYEEQLKIAKDIQGLNELDKEKYFKEKDGKESTVYLWIEIPVGLQQALERLATEKKLTVEEFCIKLFSRVVGPYDS